MSGEAPPYAGLIRIAAILGDVKVGSFSQWDWELKSVFNHLGHESGVVIWGRFRALDADGNVFVWHDTRQWLLELDASEDAILRTALLCVLTCHEHEAREFFTYKGERVFNPHAPL